MDPVEAIKDERILCSVGNPSQESVCLYHLDQYFSRVCMYKLFFTSDEVQEGLLLSQVFFTHINRH